MVLEDKDKGGGKGVPSSDYVGKEILLENKQPKPQDDLETYFLTLSAGMAMIQKAKDPRPPEIKFAEPVLIWTR